MRSGAAVCAEKTGLEDPQKIDRFITPFVQVFMSRIEYLATSLVETRPFDMVSRALRSNVKSRYHAVDMEFASVATSIRQQILR